MAATSNRQRPALALALALALTLAALLAPRAAAQEQYVLATCDMSVSEMFLVNWESSVASLLAQAGSGGPGGGGGAGAGDSSSTCLGLKAVGADVGAFPVPCDATTPLFETVPTNPSFAFRPNFSDFLVVNTTSFLGLCLGIKDATPAVGSLVFALPCDAANPSQMWFYSQKGGVRSGLAKGFPPSGPALCINRTATRV